METAHVVGLLKVVACGKFGKAAAAQAEDSVGVEKEVAGGFEAANVIVSGLGALIEHHGRVLELPFLVF